MNKLEETFYPYLGLHLKIEEHVSSAVESFLNLEKSVETKTFNDLLTSIELFLLNDEFFIKLFGEKIYNDKKKTKYLPYILSLFFSKLSKKYENLFFQPYDKLFENYQNKLESWAKYPAFKPKEFANCKRKMKFGEYLNKYGKNECETEYNNFMKLISRLSDGDYQLKMKYQNNFREEFQKMIDRFAKKVNDNLESKNSNKNFFEKNSEKKYVKTSNIEYEDYDDESQYLAERSKGGNMSEIFSHVLPILKEIDNERKIYAEAHRNWYSRMEKK